MTVRALRPLVSDAQRRGLEGADERLLVGDRHVQDDAIEALDLVRVEPLFYRRLPQAHQEPVLPRRVAERPGAAELRLGHAFDEIHPLAQQMQQAVVDLLERLAQRLEVAGRRAAVALAAHPAPPDAGVDARPATMAAAAMPA
jgi:hypothetical protein